MSEPVYGSHSSSTEPTVSLLHEPPHPTYAVPAPDGPPPTSYPPTAYSPTAYSRAPYATAPYAPAPVTLGPTTEADRNWATAAHLSGFVAAFVALGFLGPLVVLLTGGHRSAFVRRHAVEALNFNLSILVWLAVSALLVLVLVGLVLLPAVGILYLVASILGAMAAHRGEEYRYPLTIHFVR